MKLIVTLIYIAIVLASSVIVHAQQQDLVFDHLNSDHGLSNGNINQIHQDKFGYIWIATDDGLNKYNGYEFEVFMNDSEDTTSISNNYITSLVEEDDGDIWVGTQGGLNFYNRRLNQFTSYTTDLDKDGALKDDGILALCIDSRDSLWVGTSSGLLLMDRKNGTFRKFTHDPDNPNSLVSNIVSYIIEDHDGFLWISTEQGLSKFDPDTETFVNYRHDPSNPNSLSNNFLNYLYEDRNHNVWISTTYGGLNMYDRDKDEFIRFPYEQNSPYSLSDNFVYCITESEEGDIYVATDIGLNIYNPETRKFRKYFHNPDNEAGLSSDIITYLYFDTNERLWIGTTNGGLNVCDRQKSDFKHFEHQSYNTYSISHNSVMDFAEDSKGNVWIATDGGGLNYFNPDTYQVTKRLRYEEGNPAGLTNDKVLAVEVDSKGRLWIGMWGGGINVYDPGNGSMRRYRHSSNAPMSLSDDHIFDIMEDSKGTMWIATWGNGFNRYNPATDNFTSYIGDSIDVNSGGNAIVIKLCEDHEGFIWVATDNYGLFRFDPVKQTFISYFPYPQEGTISSGSLFSLFEDSKNRLWVGTKGGGLNLYDRETKSFKVYRENDGLPNETIKGIVEDDRQNLWLSTNKGLSKFNPETATFENYDASDGLQNNQFNPWAYLKLSSGELLFGGINGFNMFDPTKIKENEFLPPVYINDIQLFNESLKVGQNDILEKSIQFTDEIVLDHTQNFLTLEYVALNYQQSEKNQYRYILEGFQEEWVDAGAERKVTYTNLDPGHYTFKVKGSNNDGIWNEEPVTLDIVIKPPFWQTWYFQVVAVLLILGIIYIIYYLRVSAVEAQKKELSQQVQEKTKDLTKINNELNQFAYIVSHDLKAPLRGITNLTNWIEEDLEELGTGLSQDVKDNMHLLKDRVGRMQKLIEGILNYSRIGRVETEKEQVNSGDVVKEVINILEIPEGFKVNMKGTFPTIMANRTRLEQVFTNLISNALKYHDKSEGTINVNCSTNDVNHIFSVEDDGPGIPDEYQEKVFMIFQTLQTKDQSGSTGIGLTIVKKIIEEQGGQIGVDSDGKHGSKFTFTIPRQKDQESNATSSLE